MPNPFQFSDPVLGESFADRKDELETLTARMLTGQNVIVISPRRYGKTSLILNAQDAVRRRGGRTGIANLFWCQSRQDVAQELANAVVRGPLGWLRGRMEEVRRRLSDLPGAVLSIEKEGYRITLSPQQSKTDWTAEIRHIMRLLQEDRTERHPVGTRSRPGAHSCCRSTPRPRPRFWSSSTGPDVVTGEGPVGPLSHRHQTRSPGGWSIERSHQPQPPRPGAGPAWMDGPGPGPSLGDQRGHHFGRASGSPSEAELDPPHGERATQGPRAGGSC